MKNTLLGIILLCATTLTSCFSYKEIEMSNIQNVKLNNVNGKLEVQAGMNIKNPNNYKIKVKKIEADMLVNGQNVGKIHLSRKVILPRRSDQMQNFSVNTELSNLLSALPSVLFGGSLKLQLKGYIKGKVFLVSKKFPFEAEEKISAKDLNVFE
jgi:LEA14-like dessication related protein